VDEEIKENHTAGAHQLQNQSYHMKRLFIAMDIRPEKELLDAFEKVRHTLRMERINWVHPEITHLTLCFLGDTEEGILESLKSRLKSALESDTSFRLHLKGLGVFPNIHDPRVIWIGCTAAPSLLNVKKRLDLLLEDFGMEPDDRPYSPHLTLGRIKQIRHQNHLAQLMGEFRDREFQTSLIREVILYESVLKPEGPEYIALEKFPLQQV
jgi:RNA 2',3'-cyclic 3'-phosphodiesterase